MSKQTLLRAGLVALIVLLAAGWAITAVLLQQRLTARNDQVQALRAEQKTDGMRLAAPTFQINVPASAFDTTPEKVKTQSQLMNYQIGRTMVWVNASPLPANSNFFKLPFKLVASTFYRNVTDRTISNYKGIPIEYVYSHTKFSRQVIAVLLDQKELYQISVTEMNPASDTRLRAALEQVLAKFVFHPTVGPAVHESGLDGDGDHDNDSSVKTDSDHDAAGQPTATTATTPATRHRGARAKP